MARQVSCFARTEHSRTFPPPGSQLVFGTSGNRLAGASATQLSIFDRPRQVVKGPAPIAVPAEVSVSSLRPKLIRPLLPNLEGVATLKLWSSHARRIYNHTLDRILAQTKRLESLSILDYIVDNGTLKVIANRATERLRFIESRGDDGRRKRANPHGERLGITEPRVIFDCSLRFTAVTGFVERMVAITSSGKPASNQLLDAGHEYQKQPKLRIEMDNDLMRGILHHDFSQNFYAGFGKRGDLDVSKRRHMEAWLRDRDALVRKVDELGLRWTSVYPKPKTQQERETGESN